jgi:hypothetical protein
MKNGFNWKLIIKQTAILGISLNEVFEMDLWQFVCYMKGFDAKQRMESIANLALAVRIALYSSGSAFSKRRPPDAKAEKKELDNEIMEILSDREREITQKLSDEEQIELLKKQMKYFK